MARRRRDVTIPGVPPGGPPPGWTPTHGNSDQAEPADWYGWLAAHGHLRTVPTPAQEAELLTNQTLQPFLGDRMRARMGDEAYDALLRKHEHFRQMPTRGDPRYAPEWHAGGSQARIPPPYARPTFPPTGPEEVPIEGSRLTWQELMDALAARRAERMIPRAMIGGLIGSLRGGGVGAGMGDDALLGA